MYPPHPAVTYADAPFPFPHIPTHLSLSVWGKLHSKCTVSREKKIDSLNIKVGLRLFREPYASVISAEQMDMLGLRD